MPHFSFRLSISLAVLAAMLGRPTVRAEEGVEFFEKKVRPVLVRHCYRCHSTQAKKQRGGLRLDSRASLLRGGESGPALVAGRPEKSKLIEAVGYKNVELQMPPRDKLPDAAIADLTAWVTMGAPWPKEKPLAAETNRSAFDLAARKAAHWAWQPIQPRTPPPVRDGAWPRDPIDRFLLAKLEDKGLPPAKPADKRTLLRRLYFDLIGLPPTPEEIAAFLADSSAEAVEKVVDRLLASPRFGERWGRHWLDLVRYSETRGHEFDYPIPNAYHYRDYVIRAINADLPYDQFVVEHIAGDLLAKPRLHPAQGFNESILATGFWFLGEAVHSPVDVRQDQADRFDNKVDVFSKAFLGLTVACARCHDHKFDAISTKDYYALFGFLQSSPYRLARFDSMEANRRIASELAKSRARNRRTIQKALADSLRPGAARTADYLTAAREVLRSNAAARPKRLEEIAHARALDAILLSRWVEHLRTADKSDLLHVLLKENAVPPEKAQASAASRAKSDVQIILDYERAKPEDWLPDGFAFGPAPMRPGDLHIEGTPEKPALSFREIAAAEKDPRWDVLKSAPGQQNDPGALGGAKRAGRTLRTPTFGLTGGKVYYLVKGSGFVYAALGSHLLIAGPLHGQLIRTFNTGERFQWIAHDLSAYQGQRVHLEFTPTGNTPFAIARIVQGTNAPPSVEPTKQLLTRNLADAESYQRLFLDLVEKLATDQLRGGERAAEYANLANWMTKHAALFGASLPIKEVRAILNEQARIAAGIQRESRLCVAMSDGSAENDYVFIRGSHKARGETVPRRFLEALAGPAPLATRHGSGRLELARQMIDPKCDPFLPRVMVNRVWHHLFGRGLVASTDNFGLLGEKPTHPELLDYLAHRFIQEGWSLKKLIRALVLSRTYQMASQSDKTSETADPGDLLLHRMRMRRLEGEAIRDAMLLVSGRFVGRMYGPPVPVHLTAFQDGRGRPASGPLDGDGRRSVYLGTRRNFLSSFLLAFDTPSPFSTVGRRTVSNVPAQSLILLNDPFVHQQAQLWAKRVLARPGSPRERIQRMYESAFTRAPTESEWAACVEFLQRQPAAKAKGIDHPEAWADLAHVLFNVKEFIFLN